MSVDAEAVRPRRRLTVTTAGDGHTDLRHAGATLRQHPEPLLCCPPWSGTESSDGPPATGSPDRSSPASRTDQHCPGGAAGACSGLVRVTTSGRASNLNLRRCESPKLRRWRRVPRVDAYTFERVEIDPARFELRHNGVVVHVEAQMFDVLLTSASPNHAAVPNSATSQCGRSKSPSAFAVSACSDRLGQEVVNLVENVGPR